MHYEIRVSKSFKDKQNQLKLRAPLCKLLTFIPIGNFVTEEGARDYLDEVKPVYPERKIEIVRIIEEVIYEAIT